MTAVSKAKVGQEVTLGLKIGKLTLSQGEIKFASEKLTTSDAVSPRQHVTQSHMAVRNRTDVSPGR